MRKVVICMTAALLLACASCGNKDKIYPVSGKVTYNGFPARGAVVSFHRQRGEFNDPTIMGIVKEDGSFELVCGPLGMGAPPGDYDVLIEWKRIHSQGKRRIQTGSDLLHGRYADPKHPLLHVTVTAGATQLLPFELVDAAVVPTRGFAKRRY